LDIEIPFREGDPLVLSINRRRRGENETVDSVRLAGFQERNRSTDVHILIKNGFGQRGPDARSCRKMDDALDPMALENLGEMFRIPDIACDQFESVWECLLNPLRILDLKVGIVEVVEIIETENRRFSS
jgi:hypothetical protein